MADNYLEKKMEEHRQGAMRKPLAHRLSPAGNRRGTVALKIDELRVLVDGSVSTEMIAAIVRKLRNAGCRVAFVSGEDRFGRELSQSTGSRFYPKSTAGNLIADIKNAWGGIDVVIAGPDSDMFRYEDLNPLRLMEIGETPDSNIYEKGKDMTVNYIATKGLTSENVAHLCLLLCLADSGFIRDQLFKFA